MIAGDDTEWETTNPTGAVTPASALQFSNSSKSG
jgi:hypothetical protein